MAGRLPMQRGLTDAPSPIQGKQLAAALSIQELIEHSSSLRSMNIVGLEKKDIARVVYSSDVEGQSDFWSRRPICRRAARAGSLRQRLFGRAGATPAAREQAGGIVADPEQLFDDLA